MKKFSIFIIIMILLLTSSIVGYNYFISSKNKVNMVVLFKSDITKYSDFENKLKENKKISLNIDYLIDDLDKDYYEIDEL